MHASPDLQSPAVLLREHHIPLCAATATDRFAALLQAQGRLPILHLQTPEQSAAYRFSYDGERLEVSADSPTSSGTVIELGAEDWLGLIDDIESTPALIYGDRIRCLQGDAMTLIAWEPALRALYRGIPVYDPHNPDLRDGQGLPVAPDSRFSIDDDPGILRNALDTLGYLVVHDVFSADEIARFRVHADRLRSQAREGDHSSWWGKNRDGEPVLCRVLTAGSVPELHDLYQDSRIQRLRAIMPEGLKPANPDEQDGLTVIFKNPAMVEGLSDLPWHRDCGMGGHALMCPTVIISIYLYDATDEAGALRFLPGSHKASFGFSDASDPSAPRGVRADARAGSVTLHFGDVMHAAPEPQSTTGPFRQSILLAFQPAYQHHRGQRHYNDVLLDKSEDGQIPHLKAMVAGEKSV